MNTAFLLYASLVLAVAAQRLWEVRRATRHTRVLLKRGGIAVGDEHYPAMATLHTLWLIACIAEASFRGVPPSIGLSITAFVVLAAGQSLRLLAMAALGERWTTRIVILPGHGPVTGGIFRYIRHPNYLGVFLELAALPLVFGCFNTAAFFSLANLALMLVRIPAEEKALEEAGGYQQAFAQKNRFIPGGLES